MRNRKNSIDLNLVLENFKMDKPKKTVFSNYRIEENELLWVTSSKTEKTFTAKKANWYDGLDDTEIERLEQPKNITHRSMLIKNTENEHKRSQEQQKKLAEAFAEENKGTIHDYSGHYGPNFRVEYQERQTNLIAKKIVKDNQTIHLGNSSVLELVGRKVSYGHESLNRSRTNIQDLMENSGFVMIPFNTFETDNLDLNKFNSIEKRDSEIFTIKMKNPHSWQNELITKNIRFTGTHLFEVDSHFYLLDIDRKEIENKLYRPFITRLPREAASINEAYEILKPVEVKDAESKGLEVKRQGAWFFIPTSKPYIPELTLAEKVSLGFDSYRTIGLTKEEMKQFEEMQADVLNRIPIPSSLTLGKNKSKSVEMGINQNGMRFVKGSVNNSHDKQDSDLVLKSWHYAVPNTSVMQFIGNAELKGNI